MRALLFLFFVFGFFQISAPSTFAEPLDSTSERNLKRLNEVAEQVRLAYCEPDKRRAFEGAIKGINAMPERKDAAPLVLISSDFDGFSKAYQEVLQTKIDKLAIDRAALTGMAKAFNAANEFVLQTAPKPEQRAGILLQFKVNPAGPVVIRPIPFGPAAEVGILAGDRLKAIDGKSLQGLSQEEIAHQLRGNFETNVTVTIERDGVEKTFAMRRVPIDSPQVRHRVVDGIGVLTIFSLQEDTGKQVQGAIRAIRQEVRKPKGYIIDLRYNGGGLIDGAIGLVDTFASRGLIVTDNPKIQCKSALPRRYYARPNDDSKGAPLVVLVNNQTAAGGELAAAALRELRQAILVGQTTNGSTQSRLASPVFISGEFGYLILEQGTYLPSSGESFVGTGVVPDVLVEAGGPLTDTQLEHAFQILNAARK